MNDSAPHDICEELDDFYDNKKEVNQRWRNKYPYSIRNIPIREEYITLFSSHVREYSTWADEGPLRFNGFSAHVVEANNIEEFMDNLRQSMDVMNIEIKYVVTSQYACAQNILTSTLYEVITSENIVAGNYKIEDTIKKGCCIFIGMRIQTRFGIFELFVDVGGSDKKRDEFKTYFYGYSDLTRIHTLERFIHSCKTNVVDNYDPELMYTRIDSSLIK